ncbi:DUF3592 domain-containing protein [Streptomyces sp. NPDC058045]|uniref:DUF3592 domain-containing protein n=1 Tax=Streptomyces sp. NPDC058045 TaxID=3346311 RepID=UPI0036EEA17F
MWLTMTVVADLVLIAFTVHEAVTQWRLRREGLRTWAMVISHRAKSAEKGGGVVYYPLLRFVDAQGRAHEFEPKESGVRGLPVGGRAPVIYLPDAPGTVRVDLTCRRISTFLWALMGITGFTTFAIRLIQMGG